MASGDPITVDDLDRLDSENLSEDKICIVREHGNGEISWRFASTQMGPMELMQWTLFYSMMVQSGYRGRIEALEKEVAELKTLLTTR